MTLRKKILVGYASIVIVLGVMMAWIATDFRLLGGATEGILRENYRSILAADAMIKHLERQDSATLLLLVEGRDAAQVQFHENQSEFLRWLARAEDNVTIPGEQDVLDQIDAAYSSYLVEFARVTGSVVDAENAQSAYRERLLPLFEETRAACTALRDMNHDTMVAESAKTRMLSRASLTRVAWFGGITILAGFLLSVFLADLLSHPLREMMAATSMLSEGNYDVSIRVDTKDELGELARRITVMSRKLKGFHDLNVGRLMEERKRLEAIVRSIADGVVVIDERLRVTSINPAAATIFDAWPDDTRDRPVIDLVGDEAVYEAVKETLAGGKVSISDREIQMTRDDGDQQRHYRCAVTPVVTEDGASLGAVLIVQDLTRLLEVDRLKNEFVMAASHELRTPLTGMVMSLKLLAERIAPHVGDDDRELIAAADDQARRLRSLVEELLDLSKVSSGRLDLAARRTSVTELVQPAVLSIRPQVEAKGITYEADLPEDLPEVSTDPQKVGWVVTNLLSNAMRYTGSGGVIRLTARAIGEDVHVSVSDTGEGIPLEHQARIFDPHVQIRPRDRAAGGLGIGLSLARSIVRAQGGTIWVDSTPGEGSTFTFTMPVWRTVAR